MRRATARTSRLVVESRTVSTAPEAGTGATDKSGGWPWFAAWAIVGVLGASAWLSAMTVGVFILPLAGIAAWSVGKRARTWSEMLGLLLGAGLLCFGVAYGAHRLPDCDAPRPSLRPLQVGEGQTFSCDEAVPRPWLVAGSILVGSSLFGYLVARRSVDVRIV